MEATEIDRRVDHFFTTMETVASAATALGRRLAYELGSDLNLLNYMRTDELGLSHMIADLLDPNGVHGQGSAFLELFLRLCDFNAAEVADDLSNIRVLREKRVSEGQIDIVLQSRMVDFLIIENKPYASEQPDQMERYASYIKRAHVREGGHLVYLSGRGTESHTMNASTQEEFAGRYATICYTSQGDRPSLSSWLRSCEARAKAPKVRVYLSDFADWVEQNFADLSEEISNA
ncbi:PD-(D/E)XK nuclease family protein [Martelella radicis]|uniref:PD-(D/E)XK nuclease superfamily protein n=1 Tax=Martelella radicis TaxID=1397476 RepID=A0A7W6KKT0_9HYPH|nr:PD-(D/E)XK nuclease family protein [Martelella radicis]MBB4122957.1 hypothetical protein [Martelella radicis]